MTSPSTRAFGPRETFLLLALAGTWGLSFLFIEVALRGFGPMWIVVGRTGVGGLVLFTVLRLRGHGLPGSARMWGKLLILGVVTNAVPWSAVAWAQQSLPSGLVALLMAAVPSSTLVVSALVGLERFTLTRVVGLGLALSGVGLTVAADLGDPGRLLAIGVIVVATMMYASGAVFASQRVSGTASPLTIATGQVVTAFLVTVPVALLIDPVPDPAAWTPAAVGAVVALGALGTGFAFLVFYTLIERVGATNTTLVTYLIPLVAVVAGAVLLDERLGLAALFGGILIVCGVWLAQRGTRAAPASDLGRVPFEAPEFEAPEFGAAASEAEEVQDEASETTAWGARGARGADH